MLEAVRLGPQPQTPANDKSIPASVSPRPRPLLVRTKNKVTKTAVMSARKKLKGTDMFLNEDLSRPEQKLRRQLVPWHGSIQEEDALQLERIQTAVARCILQAPWRTPKSELLQALDWPSLRWRREIASLCLLHRFLNLQQEPLTNCLPPFASSRNPRSQRKPKQLILPAARTTRHTTSFFLSASVAWNTLPAHIQNLTNAEQFRKALTKHFYSQRFTLRFSIWLF